MLTGTLWYPHPFLWSQAWWVPLLFAGASVALVAGAGIVRRLAGAEGAAAPRARELAGDGIAFFAAYAYTGFSRELPDVVLLLLTAWWISRVVRGRPPWAVAYSLVAALLGTAWESGWSALGFFHYHQPDLLGVPRWLPAIYLHAGLLGVTLEPLFRPDRERAGAAARSAGAS